MSKTQKQERVSENIFELDDALMSMFPKNGKFKKNRTIYSMETIMQQVFPSDFIRKYWEDIGYRPEAIDIAVVIYNSELSLYSKLILMKSLQKFADKDTQERIQKYLNAEVDCLRRFQKKEDGYVFELQFSYGKGIWTSLALMLDFSGLVWLGNLWKNSPCHKNENVKFMILKRLIYDHQVFMPKKDKKNKVEQKQKSESKGKDKTSDNKKREYPYLPEDAGCITLTDDFHIQSCECGYRNELSFDRWTIGSFSVPGDNDPIQSRYVSLPFPFHKGDIVRNVIDGTCGIILTAPKEKESFTDFEKNKRHGLGYYDYFTEYICVYWLREDNTFHKRREHIFNLEPVTEIKNYNAVYKYLKWVSENVCKKGTFNIENISEIISESYKDILKRIKEMEETENQE